MCVCVKVRSVRRDWSRERAMVSGTTVAMATGVGVF